MPGSDAVSASEEEDHQRTLDLMREVGVSGLVMGKGDCVRSVRHNRCLVYVIDGQPAGTNVFIISHKTDALDGKFANRIEFTKENNFSVVKQKSA